MLTAAGFVVVYVRGVDGAALGDVPLVRRAVSRRTSVPYAALQRTWPGAIRRTSARGGGEALTPMTGLSKDAKATGTNRTTTMRARMPAVVQIIASLDPSSEGPPVSAVATALALRRQGAVSAFAFPVAHGRDAAHADLLVMLRSNGTEVHTFQEPRIFGRPGQRWGISPGLGLWILRHAGHFDVVHAHSAWTFPTFVALLAARTQRRLAVVSAHESLTNFDQAKSQLASESQTAPAVVLPTRV